MKNFTNNFKQFTSRLSARWLIMALMMLVGTSSAWGAYYVTGDVIGNWDQGENKRLEMTSHESDVVKAQVSQGGDFKIHYAATSWDDDWYKTIQKGTSTGATITGNDNGSNLNLTLQSGYSFPVTIYFDPYGNDGKPYVWAIATVGSSGGDKLTRIVAGTPASVFGTEWEPGNINNEMTETSSGVYTIDYYTNFQSDTAIKFKVTDGTWSNSWGKDGKDYEHTINKGCQKTTITYKTNGNTISVTTDNSGHCCETPAAPNVTGTTNVVKCGDNNVTTNGTITIDNYENTSTYKLQLGSNEAQTVTPTNGVFSVSTNGTYKLTVTNSCGSSSTKSDISVGLTQNQVSISDITGPDNICSGNSADYSITAIDGVTYNWSINSDKFTLGTNGSNSVTVTANGTEQIQATLTITATKNECPTPNSKKINLIPLPTISTVSPTEGTVCSETTIGQLEKTLTITKSANSSTKWYKGGDEKSSSDIVEQGQYTIKAVSNTASCISNSSVTYNVTGITTIPTGLTVDINGKSTASICGGTATINAKATGATSYSLYKGNGGLVETINDDANGVSFTVSEANTYKVKATNNCGSTNYSSEVTLNVNPVPSAPSFTTEGETTCAEKPVNPALSNALGDGEYLVWYDASEGGTNLGSYLTSSTKDGAITYYAAVSNGTCESSERTPYTVDVETDPIEDLTLTLVDENGNSLPSNYTYCQGDDVNVKLTYNGGIYWGEPEWNSTITAGAPITSGLRYDATNKIGAGTYTFSNLQASGTLAVALTMCGNEENNKAISNELSITVAPVPVIESVTASKISANCYEYVTLTATTSNLTVGTIVKWYEGNTLVGSGDTYRFTKETAGTANIEARVQNTANCAPVVKAAPAIKFTAESGCSAPAMKQGGIIYLVPNSDWKSGNAWFAAAFIKTKSNVKYSYWRNLYDDDGDGTYACEIPSGYSKVVFCRMNPDAGTNVKMNEEAKSEENTNWNYKWDDTGEITIPTTAKKYTITGWKNSYKEENLDGNKTFRTVELNAGAIWVQDNAHFKIHAWSEKNQNEGNWIRMVDANGDKIYHADVPADFTHLVFGRFSSKAEDNYKIWEQTANLDITGGTRYVISKSGGYDYGVNAEGYWSWPDKSSTYALGVSTISAVIGADNTSIICNAQIFKTSCAPAIWYGFQYSKDGGDFVNVEVGNTYVTAGKEYTYTLSNLEKGTYRIRARVQYANKTAVHDEGFTVVIADQCEEGYDFAIGGTSVAVQACGGNRVLPAIEILSNNTPAGKTITWEYEWKNADGTAATNLDFTSGYDTPTFIGIESQSYKVRVIKREGINIKCVQTADYQVAYDDNSPKAVITAPATVKINEAVTIQGAVHYTESFTWTVKENGVDVTSTMLSDVNSLNPTFNTKEAGTYDITLTAAENLSCPADDDTHTITIEGPEEDCASSEIEIAVDLTNQGNFNTGNDVYIFDECTYITKLNKENTYIFTKEYIEENGYPKVMIASQQDYGQHYAYMKPTQLTEKDHLGKKVTFKFNNSAYQDQNNAICTYYGKNYNREYYDISVTTSDISNTVSAPTISSPKAVVNDDTKIATLSAYLAKTGCSAITNYGFQYIMSDTEPSESDWTNSNKTTTQDFTNNIVIGKTFKWETSELGQAKYWFRAYAKNAAGKISYTSPISFEIIADGPYPVFIDAVQGHESEAALYITNDGYVEVKIYNKGKDEDDDVLEGSYKLIIENQNQNILFTPLVKNTPIEHQTYVTFTSKDPVANLEHYNITATLTYKGRKDTRNISKCTPIKAALDTDGNGLRDTIYYTIDAAAVTDKCMLVFPTVYEAVEHLKKSSEAEDDYKYTKKIGNGYILQQPVVMQVAYSTNRYKGNISVNTTGGGDKANALIIPIIDINNDDDDGNKKYNVDKGNSEDVKYYSLTIRALNENAIPTLQHIAIRDSRYITLDKLNIVADNSSKDNAIDIDCNNNSWVGNTRGKFKNTYVTVKNCDIKSKGFTCVHVSAVDKVHFLNNEITAELDDEDVKNTNVRCWGASVKFIRSTNLSFIRNNFMGTHATSIWLQEVDGALLMNNVLWNNNKIEADIFAMFRIVHQTGDYYPKNIGIYYNTLFLDNNGLRSASPKFNFLTLNSDDQASDDDPIAHNGTFETGTIEFMYNNCYSYDTRTPGRPDNPFKGRSAWDGLCHNNFWSAKDNADFSFNGCNTVAHNVDVKANVCTTGATSPHSLVISGDDLNLGVKPATTLAKQLGADLLKSDRNRSNVRPESTGWTLGAYQQTEPEEVSTIIWQGEASTDWDNRNNWIDADTKRVLTCTHELAEKLTVIIPAPQSEKYQVPGEEGIVNYPIIPQFGSRNTTLYGNELVNAGQKVGGANSGKFAEVIEIEYGGSLQGVENLVNRYGEAKTNLTAGRDQWTLVGTVVKPWTDKLTRSTRNIKSGDYFIEKQTPHVYMHYAYMDGNTAKWSEPFTSKEESLEVTDVMAINLPNQYGEYKLTSQDYYTYSPEADPKKLNDNVVPKNYEFVGEFVNEASLPYITGLSTKDPVLLNNSYPCNIDPKKLENGQGTVWMYDYKGGSFSLTSEDDVLIKPQHGFIFKSTGGEYQVTKEMLVSGDTKSRSAEDEMPIFSLNLFNANSTEGEYSRVIVKYDELGDNGPVDLDLEKMFAENASTPELYIVMYDGKYQRVHVNSKEIVIPLGIRLMTSMNVSFQKFKAEGFDKVTLVDEIAKKEYDLLSGKEVVTEKLLAGDIEGRFFLNLKEKEEDDDIEDDDNVSTEVEEDSAEQSINILVEGNNTVKVITNGVELENIYVSDMAGRTVGYKASGYSAVVELPVAQGVYMINVIGDTASRTEKVILK